MAETNNANRGKTTRLKDYLTCAADTRGAQEAVRSIHIPEICKAMNENVDHRKFHIYIVAVSTITSNDMLNTEKVDPCYIIKVPYGILEPTSKMIVDWLQSEGFSDVENFHISERELSPVYVIRLRVTW